MGKIKFEQIHEDVVEVSIHHETPIDMVEQLTKSLTARGLVEDKNNSTLSIRYYYRPSDKANQLADQLIKSLESLAKDDEPYWTPKAKFAHQKQLREQAIADRRAKLGMGVPSTPKTPKTPSMTPNISNKPGPNSSPSGVGAIPFDAKHTAGGTGKRYAYIKDPIKKIEEHAADCDCGECAAIEKGDYGPKGGGQYTVADNIRRKARNTGDTTGFGNNVNTKAYSSKPGQLSLKEQAAAETSAQRKMNRKQPVRQWTPEEIEAENKRRGFKKSAEDEIMELAGLQSGEEVATNQLVKLMQSKSMFKQPTPQEFLAAGEVMGLGTSEEVVKSADSQWNGTINNWLAEATKPISQRFASEEEELRYWNSIKVGGGVDDGSSGY